MSNFGTTDDELTKREMVVAIGDVLGLEEGEDYPDESARTQPAGFYKSGIETIHSELVTGEDAQEHEHD